MNKNITRRDFITRSAMLAGGAIAACSGILGLSGSYIPSSSKRFNLMQVASVQDKLSCSYIIKTGKGSLAVIDGGQVIDTPKMRKIIGENGNQIKAWFITHPHFDHVGVLKEILKHPGDMKIDTVYHSKLADKTISLEGASRGANEFYNILERQKETKVVNIQEVGTKIKIDGIRFTILGIANPEFTTNPYNNSSMMIRVEDNEKSAVFLADAGKECGDKVLKSPFRKYLDCDYLQVAHHGQAGCNENFYKSISFKVCLWPSTSTIWNPPHGSGLTTMETRRWMDEIGIKEHHVTGVEGDWILK